MSLSIRTGDAHRLPVLLYHQQILQIQIARLIAIQLNQPQTGQVCRVAPDKTIDQGQGFVKELITRSRMLQIGRFKTFIEQVDVTYPERVVTPQQVGPIVTAIEPDRLIFTIIQVSQDRKSSGRSKWKLLLEPSSRLTQSLQTDQSGLCHGIKHGHLHL